ncbi:hypothetical protein C8F04DRAFT_1066447 [Mycena alexandri]|uniref:Secreted protein n=1 Tax=Mycena alexandri TaxID=1745969 RepID=A0AAD6TKF2_9AGAR|nr:hypothetical protein C8F04DRAFT_1066447 [Mycena alexandri]
MHVWVAFPILCFHRLGQLELWHHDVSQSPNFRHNSCYLGKSIARLKASAIYCISSFKVEQALSQGRAMTAT